MAPPAPRPRVEMSAREDQLFVELFAQYFTYVWNALRRLGVHDRDREDLAQEVFMRVASALATYDETRPPRPWLFAFAFHVASDYRRLARHRVEIYEDAPDVHGDAPLADDSLDAARRRDMLARGLDALDLPKRAVLVLHDLEGVPIPEVARVLAIAEGTASSRLRAARQELADWVRREQLRTRKP